MSTVGAIVKASRVASSRRQSMNIAIAAVSANGKVPTRTAYSSSKVRMVVKATNTHVASHAAGQNSSPQTTSTAPPASAASLKSASQTPPPSSSTNSPRIISSARIFSSLAAAAVDSRMEDEYIKSDGSQQSDSMQQTQQVPTEEPSEEPSEEPTMPSSEKLNTGYFLSSLTEDEIFALASLKTTPLSLINMFRYASWPNSQINSSEDSATQQQLFLQQRLRNAQFLHRELPIRLAQRAVDLLTLPHGLNKTSEVRGVANVYLSYVQKFFDRKQPQNKQEEQEFTNMLESLVLDQISIPLAIAGGVRTLKDVRREDLDVRRLQELEDALYRFFTARVGLRFLTEHHILSSPYRKIASKEDELKRRIGSVIDHDDNPEFLGCIQKDCDTVKEVKRVADKITRRCKECYGIAPEIEIIDTTDESNANLEFTYVPHHLRHMLAELLKNSCRATVTRYLKESASAEGEQANSVLASSHGKYMSSTAPTLAPIRVIVTKGAEDVSIKIADQGGGVPRSAIKDMWTFAHFTQDDHQETHENNTEFENDEITGGRNIRGFGLPLARIYARYFGGELTLKSMEGYGVDAYLHLPVLGSACENLPERVIKSPGNLDSSARSKDKDADDISTKERAPDSLTHGDDLLWRRSMGTPSARQTFEMLEKRAL